MHETDRSILATLAYYDALGRPLTLVEICQRLIPSQRLGIPAPEPSLGVISSHLDALVSAGIVGTQSGVYTLDLSTGAFGERYIERQKESTRKYQSMLQYAWWLQAVPYVRTLAASGSLSLNTCGAQSDWDMFVIAQAGRLYTARAGLLLMTACMGRLRTKRMRVAPDRFCFNHYITTDGLALRHRSLFTAHALRALIPIFDAYDYLGKLRHANQWIGDYSSLTGDALFVRRNVPNSRVLGAVRRTLEIVLNTYAGSLMERALRSWMQRRINREPATHQRGGRIIATDRVLEFHPRSVEAVAISRYNASLARLGMGQYTEHDSGLAR